MKLVFCLNSLYHVGGSERVWIERVNYLSENTDYQLYLITTDQDRRKIFYEVNSKINLIDLDINYYKDKELNFIKRIFQFKKKQKKHLKKLEKTLNEIQPDIVIGHGTEEKWLLPYFKGKYKIILEHHLEKNFLKKSAKNILYKLKADYFIYKEKKLINIYDEFLVLTEQDKKQWSNDRIKAIPNPLPFYPTEVSSLKNKKIISIGRLEYQKGYDILIDVWNIISKKYPDWSLEIYGEGPERENLQNKINKLDLGKSFLLKGVEKNIVNKYLESSFYVMSSRFEGMPMVLLEAMSCGLPVISFDCPCGPRDMIKDNENGFLIEFGNIEKMAKKIEELIITEEKRKLFGKNAKRNVQIFSQDKVMNQWKELFESMVRR